MSSSRAYRRCHVLYSSVRGGAYCMLCARRHTLLSLNGKPRWLVISASIGIAARPRRRPTTRALVADALALPASRPS